MSKTRNRGTTRQPTALPRRNPMHDHPLLAKGGVHQRSKKAIRQQERAKLRKEWLPLCA